MSAESVSNSGSSSLIQQHWRTLAMGAAVAAVVGGLGYLLLSPSTPASSKGKKAKGKTNKSPRSSKTSASADSVAPVATGEAEEKKKETAEKPAAKTAAASQADDQSLLTKDVSALTEEERAAFANEVKAVGNRLFQEKKYKDAITYYTRAIDLQPGAVFYANRAACHANLGNNDEVVADCTKALEFDPRYIKALHRRAQAYSFTNQLDEALKDFTAVCMLEEFKKESSISTTDRILKDIGKEKTEKIMETKTPQLPSETFVKAYMDSFRPKNFGAEVVAGLIPSAEGDALVQQAFAHVLAKEWEKSLETIKLAKTKPLSKVFEVHALNLLGTYAFLRGEIPVASETFEQALELDPKNVNVCIKRASIFMERGDLESALREYARAEDMDSSNPDLYYHRGQVKFLAGDLESAAADYKKSLALDNDFVYAHIQLGVALYKQGKIAEATAVFRRAEKKFVGSAEIANYYGEVLMEQENLDEALKNFDKAISINPTSPLPYINKAILHLQFKRDATTAEELCKKATEVDPLCDIAFIQLAQLLIHQNKLEEALQVYDQAIAVTRTEPEVMNAVSCREACAAQFYVSKLYPDVFAKLRASGL